MIRHDPAVQIDNWKALTTCWPRSRNSLHLSTASLKPQKCFATVWNLIDTSYGFIPCLSITALERLRDSDVEDDLEELHDAEVDIESEQKV